MTPCEKKMKHVKCDNLENVPQRVKKQSKQYVWFNQLISMKELNIINDERQQGVD